MNIKFLTFVLALGVFSTISAQSVLFERQIQKTGTTAGVDESSDDAEQVNQEMDKLFDDDLDMGWEGDEFNIVSTGLRFTNVTIPKGSKIDSAFLIIYSHEEEKDTAKITIWGQASDNSTTFSIDTLMLNRPKTAAKVTWTVTEVWPIWTKFRTPDVTPIIQEIVNRSGWNSGNAMTLFFVGQDQGASNKDNARDFESFENEEDPADGGDGKNHPERVPKLVVYYTKPSAAVDLIKEVQFTLYPNPAQSIFSISHPMDSEVSLQLHDQTGKWIKSFPTGDTEFDINGLPAGFYTVTAVKNQFRYTQKLIIK